MRLILKELHITFVVSGIRNGDEWHYNIVVSSDVIDHNSMVIVTSDW